MGKLVWHEYSRLVSVTASVYAVWASFWAMLYRKFFWDFVEGTVRDPGGIQPSQSAMIFVQIIVRAPVIQILVMVLGFMMIALETPLPILKSMAIYRSLVLRVVLLLFQATLTIMLYQGTNAAIYSLVAAGCYGRAIALGEEMKEAKANRGKGGGA
ncbi:hypothetical protein BD626DRAFT_390737 [Schizophyllum amplum]|uniref:DUF7727 domain-containing protein n=1 Tax=Schizophyllum amplum TaxID=97359 RepID=A0A550CXH4_9AGAR|nr:hypothetical protein BD626DRAFT_390737 [Auriculariopsis ampla]